MFYRDSFFWKVMVFLRADNLWGEVTSRQLQLVYVNWLGMLVLFLLSAYSIGHFGRSKRAGNFFTGKALVFLLVYACMVTPVFNIHHLTHAMLQWPLYRYFMSAGWSLFMAAVPCIMFASVRLWRSAETRPNWQTHLALFPLVHSVMTFLYLLNPFIAVE